MSKVRWMLVFLAVSFGGCDEDGSAATGATESDAQGMDAAGEEAEADAGSDDDSADSPPDTNTATDTPTGEELDTTDPSAEWVWGPCTPGYRGECVQVPMPLNWDAPEDSGEILIHLSRRAGTLDSERSLWLLQGGPGGSARGLAQLVDAFAQVAPEYTIYTIEHRGVATSGQLACPEQEAADSAEGPQITIEEWPACETWVEQTYGDRLPWLNPTQSARDLLYAVERLRQPGERVLALGLSYGTYWAHRALQLDPSAFDGVILDSIIPPGADYAEFEGHAHETGVAYLDLCAADTECSERLDSDPQAFMADVLDRMEDGHCADSDLGAESLKLLGGGVLLGDQGLRSFLAPILYRLDRCNEGDIAALNTFLNTLFPEGSDGGLGEFSLVLQNHVVLSELWGDPPATTAGLQEQIDGQLFAFGAAPNIAASYETWPRYPRPDLADEVAQTDAPLLMLVGDLDPRAPPKWGDRLGTELTGPHQHYFVIPGATHGVMFQSAVSSPLQLPCGLQLVLAFMEEPTASLDAACLDTLLPTTFAPPPELSDQFFGTLDPWGGR